MTVQRNTRVADWIRINAANIPDRPCFVTDTESFTFARTNSRVNRLADGLRRIGVGRGDRVALFATDSPRYMEALLACMKLGAVYVPLNFRLAQPELETLLRTAEPTALFFSDRYTDMVRAVDVPGLTATISLDSASGDASHEKLVAEGADVEIDTPVADEDLVSLAFTSGTTSLPKGVMHSQRLVKHMVTQCIVDRRMTNISFHYTASPLFHVAGTAYTLSGVARGHSALILPEFDAAKATHWLAAGGLDGALLVPTMIDAIVRQPGIDALDFSHLKSIAYGAAPMSPSLLRRAMAVFDCEFMNMFGAGTEAGLQTVLTPEDHRRALDGHEHLLGSIGKAGVGVMLRLCEPELVDGRLVDVPDGEVGEIVTRADAVMSGYLNQPEQTARVLVDGWFRGGDLARRDTEGYLYLSGRKDDMIIRGGQNIYPVEIEDVLSSAPGVREAAVVGVPDDHWGETVRAHIVPDPAAPFDEAAVRAHCRARLAAYKVPAVFTLHAELPRNASGKVLKRELRGR